ncbi:hypothetical protein BHE74_00012746 [Ensete ventricosum]|nr:hypothetical protein BHE74_00012746 [Ensete ventricosum]
MTSKLVSRKVVKSFGQVVSPGAGHSKGYLYLHVEVQLYHGIEWVRRRAKPEYDPVLNGASVDFDSPNRWD